VHEIFETVQLSQFEGLLTQSAWGHSRPGQTESKSSHVGYCVEIGSRFRALAARGVG